MKTDIDIARAAEIKAIEIIAAKVGIGDEYLEQYGKYKAKVNLSIIPEKLKDHKDGKLILVTAISPTPAGEGKTTTSVGLVDGLCHIGKKAMICLREPSLGPCFGMKGGAAGGGFAAAATSSAGRRARWVCCSCMAWKCIFCMIMTLKGAPTICSHV